MAVVQAQPIVWTSEKPTVPGVYLYRYRLNGVTIPLTQMTVLEDYFPVPDDTSETRWFGPIPEDLYWGKDG